MGRINHHAVDNGYVEFSPSGYQFEYTSDSIPDTDTTMIKSIDDYEMDQLLELFHSEHDDDILGVELHMIQA